MSKLISAQKESELQGSLSSMPCNQSPAQLTKTIDHRREQLQAYTPMSRLVKAVEKRARRTTS
eukprot:4749107-Amphidinium_carterae.3